MNVGAKEVDSLGKNDISKNTNHKCDICGTEYKRFGYLKLHMKNKHESDSLEARGELGVKCKLCDIRYDEVKYLNRHNKIHHKTIICSWCNLECGDKENYDDHIMTHLHCDVCGKKFDKPSKLNRHLKTHVQTFEINHDRLFQRIMLVNNIDEDTIGFMVEKDDEGTGSIVKEYEPAIMWNLAVKRYVSPANRSLF